MRRKLLFRLHHAAERRDFAAVEQARRRKGRAGVPVLPMVIQPKITRTRAAQNTAQPTAQPTAQNTVQNTVPAPSLAEAANYGAEDTFDFRPFLQSPTGRQPR